MANSTRTVRVTSAQKSAAKGLIARSAATGRFVSSSVAKIANAKSTSQSAVNGSFANKTSARSNPGSAGTATS